MENNKKEIVESKDEPRFCHDCDKKLDVKEEEVQGGKLLKYKDGEDELFIFKCDDCFAKNPALTNFRKCEVYSRVVGYIRPVQQWHKGKQQEWSERKGFNMPTE